MFPADILSLSKGRRLTQTFFRPRNPSLFFYPYSFIPRRPIFKLPDFQIFKLPRIAYLSAVIKPSALIILAWFAGVLAQAQKPVELLVSDAYSGKPIPGAWVILGREGDSLFTDRDGRLSESDLRDAYFVAVGKTGYFTDTIYTGRGGIYRLFLRTDSRNLNEVAVVSEKPGGNQLETPVYGFRLTLNKPFTFDGLQMAAAINTVPGVQWEQRGLGGSAVISVRGSGWRSNFGIRGTRIYFDEIPFSQPDGFGLPELVDPYFFDSFEMFKGPAGASYGGYSGGSLVLHAARPTEYGLQFNFGITAGSNRLMRAQAGASYTGRTFSLAASGMSMVHKGYRQQEYVNRKLYTAKADWQLHANHSVAFRLFYGLANWGLPGDLTAAEADTNRRMANPYALQAGAKLEKEFVRGGLTYTFRQGERFSSDLTVFGNWADKYNPYGTTPSFSGIKTEAYGGGGVREVLRVKAGKNKVRWNGNFGFEYQGENVNGRENQNIGGTEGALKSRYIFRNHLFFAFAQSTMDLPLKFKLDFGLVAAVNGMEKRKLSPDTAAGNQRITVNPGAYPYLGLTKTFGKNYAVYTQYHNGYTTPTLNEMLSDDGVFNTGLKNETVHQLEAGTRGQLGSTAFSWGLGAYVNFYRNYIVPFYPVPGGPVHYQNAGGARHIGVEAQADWYAYENTAPRAGLRQAWLGLRYAFIDPRFTRFTDAGTDYAGKRVPGTPSNKVSLLYNMKLRYGFALNLDLAVRDRVVLDFANTASAPGVFKGNVRVSWSGKVFSVLFPELFFGINNFTDAKDFSFFRVNAPGGRYYNPDTGIFFYGGVQFKSAALLQRKKK